MNNIEIFDTTLRDGQQGRNVSFSLQEQLKIVNILDEFAVDYIEGGWPGANPKVEEFFQEMQKVSLKNSKLVAFGSTHRPANSAEDDLFLNKIINSQAQVACIFGKTWDLHVDIALNIPLEENLTIIENSCKFLAKEMEVFFDAEHFFDGFKKNQEYAIKCLQAAQKGGATRLILCDTNGGTMPQEIAQIIEVVKQNVTCDLGIHAHNDCEMAVANSVVAVQNGVRQVQGTINGYGERCGNANLCSIMPSLAFKLDCDFKAKKNLSNLKHLSVQVANIANVTFAENQAYVGSFAFAHKGGVHVSAVLKNSATYEHINPSLVGNVQVVTVSDQSGLSNLMYKADKFNLTIDKKDPRIKDLLSQIKDLEKQGYSFEEAEASLELLMMRSLNMYERFFELHGFRVINEKRQENGSLLIEASIKLKVNDNMVHTVAEGNGPVSALSHALQKALQDIYPKLAELKLTDYKVRVIDSKKGSDAKVRVCIEYSDGNNSWYTIACSTNIVEASWLALIDAIEYKLIKY